MPHVSLRLLLSLVALFVGAAVAQAPELSLSYDGVYLSDVSRGLDALPSYRQHYVVETERQGADGAPQVSRTSWTYERAASGDLRSADASEGLMASASETYLAGGRAFYAWRSADSWNCRAEERFEPGAPAITVSDTTGFTRATRVAEGEVVNGVLSDRYRLEPPAFHSAYRPDSLVGELWLAREGGFIVRFRIAGESSSSRTRWSYDLEEVGSLATIELPDACRAAG